MPSSVRSSSRGERPLTVDIHCHMQSDRAIALMAPHSTPEKEPSVHFATEQTRAINTAQADAIHEPLTTPARRIADMDAMGIDVQAISPAPHQYFYWAEPELGREVARTVNNDLAELVATNPERFVGLGTVPLQEPRLAVAELNRCVGELNMRGVELGTNIAGEELAQPALEPFFARAEDLGILLFLHPMGFTEARRLTNHYFNNLIGNPLDTTVALAHLIFDGVLDRHPDLKICAAHGGGYLPAYAARMDHGWKAREDCRVAISEPPTSYLSRVHFDTMVFEPKQLRTLIERFGVDRILLGSDYPFDMGEQDPVALVNAVGGLSEAERALIRGSNAARLLGLA
jgi:aminocarboxymuconate-semialdehyde decarboxylase